MKEETLTQTRARMMAQRDDYEKEDNFHDNRRHSASRNPGWSLKKKTTSIYGMMFSEEPKTIRIKKKEH